MNDQNRNTILAVILSGMVLLGWQYFFVAPQMEKQQAAQKAQQQAQQTQQPQAPGAPAQQAAARRNPAPRLLQGSPDCRGAPRRRCRAIRQSPPRRA